MMLFEEIDLLKKELDSFRTLPPELMETIEQKFRVEWTYSSNAIEGNTLTLQETAFFLRHGLTSKGKPLRDYLNLVLLKNGYLSVIIKQEKREDYYKALMKADEGNIGDFIKLVAR
jgi:Fic family protein